MRILLTILLLATVTVGQIPEQGPPPKNLTKRADGHFTANQDPVNPENFEVHVVIAGDTLSEIAADVLKDHRLWPQLWEDNDHIVNPHWIYPNDKILIRPITLISEAAPPPPPAPQAPPPAPPAPPRTPFKLNVAPAPQEQAPPRTEFDLTPPKTFPEVKAGDMYCSGFIRSVAVADDARVVARFNSDNGVLAGENDYVYMAQGEQDGIKTGTTYQIVRPTRKIDSPNVSGDRGTHFLEVAQIRVTLAQEDFAMARVVQSCEAIEMGDLIVPFEQSQVPMMATRRPFSPTMTASGEMRGAVITTKDALANSGSGLKLSGKIPGVRQGSLERFEHGLAHEGGIVYVDVGREEGAKPGDLLIVFREVDVEDIAAPIEKETVRRQRTAIGELVILKVEDRASTALVTYSTDGVSRGDAVERR